jgi:hypothetical protein
VGEEEAEPQREHAAHEHQTHVPFHEGTFGRVTKTPFLPGERQKDRPRNGPVTDATLALDRDELPQLPTPLIRWNAPRSYDEWPAKGKVSFRYELVDSFVKEWRPVVIASLRATERGAGRCRAERTNERESRPARSSPSSRRGRERGSL